MNGMQLLLLLGGAYLVYEYLYGSSSSSTATGGSGSNGTGTGSSGSGSTNTGHSAPTITGVSGTIYQTAGGILGVTVSNIVGTPAFVFNRQPVNANLTGTPGVFTVNIPGSLATGTTGGLGVTATNGSAAINVPIVALPGTRVTASPEPLYPVPRSVPVLVKNTNPQAPAIPAGSINGNAYTTVATFQSALVSALNSASNNAGSASIDSWNFWMVNSINASFLQGGVGPDPTLIANDLGVGRSDSITASDYVKALVDLNLLVYPRGGLSALTRGINRVNKHPFAGRSVKGVVH